MTRRAAATLGLGALLLAGAFLFLHTGGRADGVCERGRFVAADGLSLWPPGARCTYGEPARTDVLLDPRIGLVLVAVLAAGAVAIERRPTRA